MEKLVSWFNISQQLSITQPLSHSPPHPRGGMEERIRKVRVRKLMDWDENSLVIENKIKITIINCNEKENNNNKKREINPQKKKWCKWKTIAHHQMTDAQPVLEQQPPASFPPSLCTAHDIMWYGISLWSVGVSLPGCVPSQLLEHPQPPRWPGSMRSWEVLDLV